MKIGDYVKYREWREGDSPLEETPFWKRGWGQTGIIVELGDWKIGSLFWPGEMAIIWTGEYFTEVCTRDIEVISNLSNINFLQTFFDNRANCKEFVVKYN